MHPTSLPISIYRTPPVDVTMMSGPDNDISLFSDEGDDGLISIIDLDNPVKYVLIHRSSIRKDMITIFSNPGILIEFCNSSAGNR